MMVSAKWKGIQIEVLSHDYVALKSNGVHVRIKRTILGAHQPNTLAYLNIQSKSDFNWKKNIVQMLMFGENKQNLLKLKWDMLVWNGQGDMCVCVCVSVVMAAGVRMCFNHQPFLVARFDQLRNYIFVNEHSGMETKHIQLADVHHNKKNETKYKPFNFLCWFFWTGRNIRWAPREMAKQKSSEMEENNEHASMNDISIRF